MRAPPMIGRPAAPQSIRAPRRRERRWASWLGRRGREGLRVLLDHLLDILLQPHQHLLLDIDIEVDFDRLVRRLDGDAACERERRRYRDDEPQGVQIPLHFVPPGGGDCRGGATCDTGLGLVCCSCLTVLRTSTFSAGESTGNGITGAITWVGSLNPLPI